MRMKSLLGALVLSTLASTAQADDKETCSTAYAQAQDLRDQHKLMAARDRLRTCAGAICAPFMKGVMVKECSAWLDDVERRLPSVVPVAKRGESEALDVKVTIDGAVIAEKGRTVVLDPGEHTAVFEAADGTKVSVAFTADEGTTAKSVVGVLPEPPAPAQKPAEEPKPAQATVTPEKSDLSTAEASETGSPAPETSVRPWRPVGIVGVALGVVGLGIGSYFGIQAASDKNNANCDANKLCDAGPLGDARNAATLSTVSFVAGGVLLAGGGALLLFGPRGASQKAASVQANVGSNGGGLLLRGSW